MNLQNAAMEYEPTLLAQAWKGVATYIMLRLLKTGDLDDRDARFINDQLTGAGASTDDVAEILALYREHR